MTTATAVRKGPTLRLGGVDVPRLDEYFGVWAVHAPRFMSKFAAVCGMDLKRHVRDASADGALTRPGARTQIVEGPTAGDDGDNLAVVTLAGTLMKQESSLDESTSSVRARQEIRAAARDRSVGAILLVIDSPGGTVAGTAELARDVAEAAQRKPVWAFVDDLAASAAYWVASQADQVFAGNGTALVGSIGTFIGLYDESGAAEKEGVKAMVFATGPLKAAGFPGAPITDDQQKYFQGIVDKTQTIFDGAVARGRGLSAERLAQVRTGEVWLAADAKSLGLIDDIQSLDETVANLMGLAARKQTGLRARAAKAEEEPMSKSKDAWLDEKYAKEQAAKAEAEADRKTDTPPEGGAGDAGGDAGTPPADTTSDGPGADEGAQTATDPDALDMGAVRAAAARYQKAFGGRGAAYLAEGLSFEQAQARHHKELREENEKLRGQLAALKGDRGAEPVAFQDDERAGKSQRGGLAAAVRIPGRK